ncbi:inhibitor of Bruton tyrosine kinase-like [Pecten maximus]|uniref:inhibitor of Bruton tyrosine kinase-like n=1 Tax=Pecten maximus TaxID=6579 RepID=UPI001458449C|nr:inhibitor of Bruton tyrosine kinase-like [Pecten maximus]
MPGYEPECGPKCRSRKHALEFLCAITKGTLQEVQAYSKMCYSATQFSDSYGRWPLHVAAACGKMDIVEWLLNEKHGDLTSKDMESSWTALHRAAFYGHLSTMRLLIQYNSDMYTRDNEGLGPLDLLSKDRPDYVSFSSTDPTETFTWGDNSNITLGHSSENRRSYPEVVEVFRKQNITIKNVVLCKYHTMFLSSVGLVYTCGHGQGGRLGHGDEETCVVPKLVEAIKDEVCIQVTAGQDHSVFLMQSGVVYTCGMNDSHQLGQFPMPSTGKSLIPKQVTTKSHKSKKVQSVCAGRFHTAMLTSDSVFTFGLNAGQLGHSKGTEKQSQPRQVAALNHSDMVISLAASSDAAIVILTGKGDLYVLHEYQCRKIASKLQEVTKLLVSGGNLDHNTDLDIIHEKGGSELMVVLLSESGSVMIWRASLPKLRQCQWCIRRQLIIMDMSLSRSTIGIITEKGEGFLGTIAAAKPNSSKDASHQHTKIKGERGRSHGDHRPDEFGMSLLDLMLKDGDEEVQVHRIPHIHRGLTIQSDIKGRNYAVQQAQVNLCITDVPCVSSSTFTEDFAQLLEEADEYDVIHDIVIQAGGHTWPAHKYILLSRSDYFNKLMAESKKKDSLTDHQVIQIHDIHPEIFEQLLNFLYTDTCSLLIPGTKFDLSPWTAPLQGQGDGFDKNEVENRNSPDIFFSKSEKELSAFEVHQKRKSASKEIKDHGNKAKTKNPVKMLMDAARKFGVKGLGKRLETVKYVNGGIELAKKHSTIPKMKFDRHKLRDLYDVGIQSDKNTVIHCHKCVLVARLEYFHSMLGSGWVETSNTSPLSLPVPGNILEILIDFLYTDSSLVVEECVNAEFLCNILVSADQLLITRLKEMCEVSIATLVNLKNVSEILEFAFVYNAQQLQSACQEFIVINLAAMFEGRHLDVLSDDVLAHLTTYYHNKTKAMSRRIVTPYFDGPSKDFLETLAAEMDREGPILTSEGSQKKNKSKKRRSRQKSLSEDLEKSAQIRSQKRDRQISVSSDHSVKSEEESLDNILNLLATSPGSTEPLQSPVVENLSEKQVNEMKLPNDDVPKRKNKSKFKSTQKPLTISLTSRSHDPSPVTSTTSMTSPTTEHPVSVAWQKSPTPQKSPVPQKFSSPTIQSASTVDVSIPRVPSSAFSLREIMEEENKRIKSPMKSSSKFSWKEAKKQQKAVAVGPSSQSIKGDHPTELTTSPTPNKPTCPWGDVNTTVKSFRDLMSEDSCNAVKKSSAPKQTIHTTHAVHKGSKQKPTVSWGIPTSRVRDEGSLSEPTEEEPPSPRSQENPWTKKVIASPSPKDSVSFTDIVKDEQQRTETLAKAAKKPLSLIQMEEQAIQELLVYYKAADILDEQITVERVVQEMATPLWKKS